MNDRRSDTNRVWDQVDFFNLGLDGAKRWRVGKLGQVIEMGAFEVKLCLINKIKFFGG